MVKPGLMLLLVLLLLVLMLLSLAGSEGLGKRREGLVRRCAVVRPHTHDR